MWSLAMDLVNGALSDKQDAGPMDSMDNTHAGRARGGGVDSFDFNETHSHNGLELVLIDKRAWRC